MHVSHHCSLVFKLHVTQVVGVHVRSLMAGCAGDAPPRRACPWHGTHANSNPSCLHVWLPRTRPPRHACSWHDRRARNPWWCLIRRGRSTNPTNKLVDDPRVRTTNREPLVFPPAAVTIPHAHRMLAASSRRCPRGFFRGLQFA